MIATGTDIKPVEIVFFMRNVRSRSFFEQMKGRGVRTISATDFNAVTPDARNKDRFVIVDAVGVTETELTDSYTLNRNPTVPFDKLLDLVSMGGRDPDVLSSLASRLNRLDRHLAPRDRESIEAAAHGVPLTDLVSGLVAAADPDAALDAARQATGQDDPPETAVVEAQQRLLEDAARPFASNPGLRQRLTDIHRSYEQTIDTVSADSIIEGRVLRRTGKGHRAVVPGIHRGEPRRDHRPPGAVRAPLQAAAGLRRHQGPGRRPGIAPALVDHRAAVGGIPPARRRSKVRGSGQRTLADVVSVVRYAIGGADELAPFADGVRERFKGWLAMQETAGRAFTPEQVRWLEAIRDHVAGSVGMEMSDFQYAPFNQQGGLGKAYELFGEELGSLLEELNVELVA